MRTAVALVAGFAAGLFAAAFSTQFRAALDAARTGDAPVDPIAAEAQEAAAYLRSMGVDVGAG